MKDTFEFCNLIRQPSAPRGYLASFDVTSLFTNIPLDETISIICENCSEDTLDNLNIERKDLKKLLELAVKENVFMFNEELYKQVDGVAMGSPLGPAFANAFLCHHEVRWLDECPLAFKPLLYRRYVDDTFLVFREQRHADKFLRYLNRKHPNIKFTCEGEKDGSFAFLDVLVQSSDDGFVTNVYRKPTFTGLGMKFSSHIPEIYKYNVVSCLVERAYKICSSVVNFEKQLSFLRDFFAGNGFPLHFVADVMSKTRKKLTSPNMTPRVGKQPVYLKIPFMGTESYDLKNEIIKLVKRHYPRVALRVILHNNNTIAKFFPFKDRVPDALRSLVVYKYSCGMCNATYVGKTKRHFESRICEHLGVSFRSGDKGVPPYSSIREHALDEDHPIDRSAFTVVARAANEFELDAMERLMIQSLNPSLNRQH